MLSLVVPQVMAMNMSKLSQESQNGDVPLVGGGRQYSNEVGKLGAIPSGLQLEHRRDIL